MFKPFLTELEIKGLLEEEAQSHKVQKRTPEQIQAIYFSGNNVLVSASAGSGKTFVMVERIMDKLLRGISLNQMFISTFTVKAAGELKERLETKMRSEIGQQDQQAMIDFLNAQLIELQTADIGTMDSFTQKLLTKYGYTIGVSPNFSVLQDKNEQERYQKEAFDRLFDHYMTGRESDLFKKLVKNFIGNSKDARPFKHLVVAIHYFSQSTSNPKRWLEENFLKGISSPSKDFTKSIIDQFKNAIEASCLALSDLFDLEDYKKTTKAGKPTANYLKHQAWLETLENMVTSDHLSIGEMASELAQVLPSGDSVTVNKVAYPIFTGLQVLVNDYKYFDLVQKYQEESIPLLELLQAFVIDFSQAYLEIKLSENSLEFSDIAHLAIEILENNPLIRELYQYRYHEVMVDEYQDNNHIQERLLELLSNGHNRFMVGDIKQSIYRFRQADPLIFNQKFKDFQSDETKGKLIILKENFRSQSEVLDSTNAIFSHLMDEEIGDINYDGLHQLKAGSELQKESIVENKTQILIYNTDSDERESIDQEQTNLTFQEVEVIVKEILKLHREQNIKFSDMTLLVSSRTRNDMILRTFREYGIPLITDGGESHYLEAVEVMVMLDTLRTIDNPLNDYALVALLKSPMFQFDEDDLARIALQECQDNRSETFFEKLEQTVLKTSQNSDLVTSDLLSKCQFFLKTLSKWRSYSKNHSLYQLVWKIYKDRYYFDYVQLLPNAEQAQANLYELAILANSYEKSGFKGLSRFIGMIDKMIAADNDLADVEIAPQDNAVTLMTIHKSKGLEFDYVFVLNCDKPFGNQDLKTSAILTRDNGIGIKYTADIKDEVGEKYLPSVKVVFPTLAYQANKSAVKIASLSEQMRLLYVAMTRARKKLYLVGKGSQEKIGDKYNDGIENNRLPKSSRLAYNCFQDWLLAIYYTFKTSQEVIDLKFVQSDDLGSENLQPLEKTLPFDSQDLAHNRQSQDISDALHALKSVEEINDKYASAIQLPALRTPSQIKELYKDVFDSSGITIDQTSYHPKKSYDLPKFNYTSKVTATELGSSLHELMQAIPLDRDLDLPYLIEIAKSLDFTDALIEKLPLEQILTFFSNTELGQVLRQNSTNVHREAPFAMLKEDKAARDNFVVRGIIDGYVLLKDSIILFDYKTDKYKHPSDLVERYHIQMDLYAEALRQSYQIDKVEKYLILLGNKDVYVQEIN